MNNVSTRIWKIVAASAVAFFLVIMVASCNQPQVVYGQPGYAQAPGVAVAPVVVAPAYGANDGFFTGLLAGHLMSGGSRSTHTVEHVYHQPAAAAPAAVAPAQRAAPIYRPAPTVTSNSRGITTVNRSTSVSRSISVGRRR